MNPEIKKDWIKALKSGSFVQGKSRFFSTRGEHCAIGVLCEVLEDVKCDVTVISTATENEYVSVTFNKQFAQPNNLGLIIPKLHEVSSLNDQGYSFKEIANYIEKNL